MFDNALDFRTATTAVGSDNPIPVPQENAIDKDFV